MAVETDTDYIGPMDVLDGPWTVTYPVEVLSRGKDDFPPFVMYFDDPALTHPKPPLPHIGMDQTFYNMEEATRTGFMIKKAPWKNFNFTYSWGMRALPPSSHVDNERYNTISSNILSSDQRLVNTQTTLRMLH